MYLSFGILHVPVSIHEGSTPPLPNHVLVVNYYAGLHLTFQIPREALSWNSETSLVIEDRDISRIEKPHLEMPYKKFVHY